MTRAQLIHRLLALAAKAPEESTMTDFERLQERARRRAARSIAARKAARTRRLNRTQYRPAHCPACGAFIGAGCNNPACPGLPML